MAAAVALYGVRHHGPGSAKALRQALEATRPAEVLIEGPCDASDLLPLLADPAMAPPVALLAYADEDPGKALFYPFAAFSPEYVAARWALANGAKVRFVDLPARHFLPNEADGDGSEGGKNGPEAGATDGIARDPIGALARAAGYEDGESWWGDLVEENPEPGEIFAAVAEAMAELRGPEVPARGLEAAREAHMRLEIAKARREALGDVAVVCGAWHVPAVAQPCPATADKALVKAGTEAGLRAKTSATWAPWTSPRLARASGYGAGVSAPGWYDHLWRAEPGAVTVRWLAKVAATLRGDGHSVSTASLIEAERLAVALAALRGRPSPGFEELREASVACLAFGERTLWVTVERRLLVGNDVGSVPDGAPVAPLLRDLQRQQKAARLKPEALPATLELDLRTETGLLRSTLLHRLDLLGVEWGRPARGASGLGTFKERWVLAWQPEHAVKLVEQLVFGSTVEQAANGKVVAELEATADLGRLGGLVRAAVTARLAAATKAGLAAVDRRAVATDDAGELLGALPPLADVVRYGGAREVDSGSLADLLGRLAVRAAVALPYAARDLDAKAARDLRAKLRAADAAIRLAEVLGGQAERWRDALKEVATGERSDRLVAGAAARLLYDAGEIEAAAAGTMLARALSPGTAVADAADFFEGFFEGAGERLVHDEALRGAVDGWLQGLEGEAFVAHLPLFRRVFASLDAAERKRLLDALFGRKRANTAAARLAPDAAEIWARHQPVLLAILDAEAAN